MKYAKRERASQQVNSSQAGKEKPQAAKTETHTEQILRRVAQYAATGHYDKAVDLLKSAGHDPQLVNAKGVCALRVGRFADAVRILRDLVLHPGCTWLRPELPIAYKTNFATALLLSGHPAGCVEMLAEIRDEQDPMVQQLRGAIKRWQSQLPFWQRLNWRIGNVEPPNCCVPIDFLPGTLEFPATRGDVPPENGGSRPHLDTAA